MKYSKGQVALVFGCVLLLGKITCVSLASSSDAKEKAVQEQLHAKHAAEAEAKRQAMPPAEHLAAMQSLLEGMKTTGYSVEKCGVIRSHMNYIPKDSPEYAKGLALENQFDGVKKADEKKRAATDAAERKKELAEWRKKGVQIGMTAERVRLSSWGKPSSINRSQYADRVEHEQWCYGSHSYLYFDDGILTSIQN